MLQPLWHTRREKSTTVEKCRILAGLFYDAANVICRKWHQEVVMAKFILSAFADEASSMLDEQIKALREEGIRSLNCAAWTARMYRI